MAEELGVECDREERLAFRRPLLRERLAGQLRKAIGVRAQPLRRDAL
ncbi:MAG TPA: hypothetical protein VFC31_13895 [Candidatus Limnocylindria bacterium]|nr:hypothetical protein [Candidatus Limnocylindria bacterium]